MSNKIYLTIFIILAIVVSYYVGLTNGLKYSLSLVQYATDTVYVEKPTVEEPTVTKTKANVKHKKAEAKKLVSTKYKVSTKGMNFIKKEESCKLTAYWDTNGYSIGYGHHGTDVKKGQTITVEEAEELFAKDIAWVNTSINSLLSSFPYTFSQDFVDGLGSLVYNCGEGNVRKTKFYQKLNQCRFHDNKIDTSDYEFTLSFVKKANITCQTHVGRRNREYNLMKGVL